MRTSTHDQFFQTFLFLTLNLGLRMLEKKLSGQMKDGHENPVLYQYKIVVLNNIFCLKQQIFIIYIYCCLTICFYNKICCYFIKFFKDISRRFYCIFQSMVYSTTI